MSLVTARSGPVPTQPRNDPIAVSDDECSPPRVTILRPQEIRSKQLLLIHYSVIRVFLFNPLTQVDNLLYPIVVMCQ